MANMENPNTSLSLPDQTCSHLLLCVCDGGGGELAGSMWCFEELAAGVLPVVFFVCFCGIGST